MPQKRETNMGSRERTFENPSSNNSNAKHGFHRSDSAFAGLVKLLYGVLQCIWSITHLPKGLEKKVDELNPIIKPAIRHIQIYRQHLTKTWQTITGRTKLWMCWLRIILTVWNFWSLRSFRPFHLKTLTSILLKLQQLSGEEKIRNQN